VTNLYYIIIIIFNDKILVIDLVKILIIDLVTHDQIEFSLSSFKT